MKSLVAVAANAVRSVKTPVPYARTSDLRVPIFHRSDQEAQMRAYGAEPTLFAVVQKLITAVAEPEWHLYRKAASGKKEDRVEQTSHAVLDLWDQPNPFMNRTEFIEVVEQHLELAGETFWVLRLVGGKPISMWPVRPDKMTPVPHPTKYLTGFIYQDPDGRDHQFDADEVVWLKYPDPLDPYHGLGPVRSLLLDLDSSREAARWNLSFFRNSAEPGGIIHYDEDLTDDEFDEFQMRWEHAHRGSTNAHRVAILDKGMTWTTNAFSMRDMQFVELRKASDEQIMLAFGMSKTLLGQTEGVNRATAEAAEYVFGKYQVVPRCSRLRAALNSEILSRFTGADRLELDYDSPVTGNTEDEARDRDSRMAAWSLAVGNGADPVAAAKAFDLPEMSFAGGSDGTLATPREAAEMIQKIYLGVGTVVTWDEARMILRRAGIDLTDAPQPLPAGPVPPALAARAGGTLIDVASRVARLGPPDEHHHHHHPALLRGQSDLDLDPDDLPDVGPLEDDFQRVIARLLGQWEGIEAGQKAELVAQVLAIAETGSLEDLANLSVDTESAREALREAMREIADDGARRMVAEAAAQAVDLTPVSPPTPAMAGVAALVSETLADRLSSSAATAAMRANGPAATPQQVATAVRDHLASLSKDTPRPMLSGALTGAQNDARLATLKAGPAGAVYASEKNDTNTCVSELSAVATRRGGIQASAVTLDDELLTHAGRWVRPSAITVSEVQGELTSVKVGGGVILRATPDHPVMAWNRGTGFTWLPAGQLAIGDLVVGQSPLQRAEEAVSVDLVLSETPHDVAEAEQLSGLPLIGLGPERVPVGAVGLDHETITDQEVDGPAAHHDLAVMVISEQLQGFAGSALDAGLGSAGHVAATGAVPALALSGSGWGDADLVTAVPAGHVDRRAPARLGTVGPVLRTAEAERGAASLAVGFPAPCGAGAVPGAVVVPVGHRNDDLELDPTVRAGLHDVVGPAAKLGPQLRVSELALDRAVHGPSLRAARDLGAALLAGRRRVAWSAVAPPLERTTLPAAGGVAVDADSTVNAFTSLSGHSLSLLAVESVSFEPYDGLVYDFTIPGDATFFADGVLVHNCGPCKAVDGKWLGNTDNLDPVLQMYPGGAFGGYVRCEGRERCRGTITGVWRRGIGDEPAPPAREAEPEPAPVEPEPAFSQPAAPEARPEPDDGRRDRERRQADLRRLIDREGEAVSRRNLGGTQGETELVTLPDGQRFVSKAIRDSYGRETIEARLDTDREEVANLLAHAVGAPAPVVHRTGPMHLYIEFVDGPRGDDLPLSQLFDIEDNSESGRLIGVLDVVTGNTDRHGGNWFHVDDRVVPIDHGYTFNYDDDALGLISDTNSSFAEHFVDLVVNDRGGLTNRPKSSNDMSPADMAVIRDRLAALRPEFERLGHSDWLDFALDRFDGIARGASGERSRLEP